MAVRIRPTDCPRNLRLLKLEVALEHHVQPDEVQVSQGAAGLLDTEHAYEQALKSSELLTIECAAGHVDHYQGLRAAINSGSFIEAMRSAAEAICDGKQREIRQLELYDVPAVALETNVTPLLPYLTRLDVVNLNSNSLATCQLAELFALLPESITRLSVESIRMDSTTLQALCCCLTRLKLASLILRNNVLDSRGLSELRPGLKCQKNLTYLMIEQNELRSEGCLQLLAVIHHLPALNFLELRQNEFSANDLSQLIRGLAALPSLRHLCINGNEVSEAAVTRTAGRFLPHLDKQMDGYFLTTKQGPASSTLKWGRLRNLAILTEKLRRSSYI